MKILAITAFYPPQHSGGYGLRCKAVLEGLIYKGHEVVLLSNRYPRNKSSLYTKGKWIFRGLHLKRAKTNLFRQIFYDLMDVYYIDKKVQDFQPDIIYLWHIDNLSNVILPYFLDKNIQIICDDGNASTLYLSRIHKRGIYFYKNIHDSLIKRYTKKLIYRGVYLLSIKKINPYWEWSEDIKIYFNSNSSLQNSFELGAPVESARVIPSGIDLEKFPFESREYIGTPVKIIIPSRIKPEKGIIDSVLLASELKKRNIGVIISIVGKIQSDEYYYELVELIEEEGLSNDIIISPMVDQLKLSMMYRQFDFCFFPSYFKTGFSRVPLEAMASGCLLVTYGNEGSSEVVDDGKTGFIVPEGNVREVTDLVEDLLKTPQNVVSITQNARKKIEEEYLFNQYIDKIEHFLSSSIHNNGCLAR